MKVRQESIIKKRAPYKRPVLVVYGKVSALTHGSGSEANEGNGMKAR